MAIRFEWDASKAKKNLRKHKVSFEEAKTIFNDPFTVTYPDPEHSDNEERDITIGISARARLLLVVHTDEEGRVRIISCRKATLAERRFYEQGEE
ncbi:MAG: BrnT family toxin [Caldilineaceae bacterium]